MSPHRDPAVAETLAGHSAAARRLAFALIHDPHDAEDVAQESLRVALERPPAAGRPAWPWLAGIVRNVSRARLRRRRRDARPCRPPAEGPEADPAVLSEGVEAQRAMLDALLRVEEPGRGALILRYLKGFPPTEVARLQDVPIETVRARLRRGLARLREEMDHRHGGNRERWRALLAPLAFPAGSFLVKKVAVGLVVLVVLGGVAWFALDGDGPRERETSREETADAPAAALAGRAPASLPTAAESAAAAVDFSAVDRDRDVHGVVVEENGVPIGGAAVRLIRRPFAREMPAIDYDRFFESSELCSGRTASDGGFALRCAQGDQVALEVSASGFARIEVDRCQPGERLLVVLPRAVGLSVVVTDESGSPVEGCTVRVGGTRRRMPEPPATEPRTLREYGGVATTDARGTVSFDGLPAGAPATVRVEPVAHGHPAPVRLTLPASGVERRVVVVPTGRALRGRVFDVRTKEPIPSALVGVAWAQRRAVFTDAEGRYVLPGWTADAGGTIYVSAARYGPTAADVGERSDVDVALRPAFRMTGRVVDARGEPIAGAWVGAIGSPTPGLEAWQSRESTLTDATGRFLLDELHFDQAHSIHFVAEGSGHVVLDVDPPSLDDPAVDLGDVRLGVPGRVEGRVLDVGDRPVAGVQVFLRGGNDDRGRLHTSWRAVEQDRPRSRWTDDLGRFRFSDLAAGTYTASVRLPNEGERAREVTVVEGETVSVELRAAAGREIRVRVGWDGEPPESGAYVSIRTAGGRGVHGRKVGPNEETTFTVPDEAVVVRAHAQASSRDWVFGEEALVPPGTRDVTLRMVRAERIRGRLLGPDGAPLVGGQVLLEVAGAVAMTATAGADGSFDLPVRPGTVGDLVHVGKFHVPVAGGPTGIQVRPYAARLDGVGAAVEHVLRAERLAQDRTLRLRTLAPDGTPHPTHVWIGGQRAVLTDRHGEAEVRDLIARPAEVRAYPGPAEVERGWIAPRLAPVEPNGQTLEIAFRQGVIVRGRVLDAGGRGVSGTPFTATHGSSDLVSQTTDGAGAFWFAVHPQEDFPLTLKATALHVTGTGYTVTLDAPPGAEVLLRPAP